MDQTPQIIPHLESSHKWKMISIFLGDLQLSYVDDNLVVPSTLKANNFVPTASGVADIGSETLPYVQVYLADQATGDVYSVTVVSGTLIATIV